MDLTDLYSTYERINVLLLSHKAIRIQRQNQQVLSKIFPAVLLLVSSRQTYIY